MRRREFLGGAAAALLLARAAPSASTTRLILLGTAGGPRPHPHRASPSQVLLVDGAAYVVDCGDGVARQLVSAGVDLKRVRRIFITHHHSDHNADYGNLVLLSWASGLRTPVDAYGPPPLAEMTRLFFELNAYEIATREEVEGRVPLRPLLRPHEISRDGLVVEDDRVKVTAAAVDHPPVTAFAYRFDTADRSIVISGDTARSDNLLKLARGADVLVHEVLHLPGIERVVARVGNASRLKEHIVRAHTTAEDVGKLAAEAEVGTLVLSHFVPADDLSLTDDVWLGEVRKHFSGEVLVGRDLMEI